MAEYHVIPQVAGASDTNAGSKASPWVTIDKAANTVAAGDTVYIAGNWTYRELVTMDTNGTSGNVTSFIADLTGKHTGYGGSVIISAFDSNSAAPTRNYCLNMNGKKFITWQGVVFNGCTGTGSAVVYSSTGSGDNFEGVTFENCVIIGYTAGNAVSFLCGAATTPTSDGLTIDKCTFVGRLYMEYAESASAQQNLKAIVKNSLFIGSTRSNSSNHVGFYFNRAATSTYGVGGLNIYNCDFFGLDTGIIFNAPRATTYPSSIRNSRFLACAQYGIQTLSSATDAVYYSNNRFMVSSGTATSGTMTNGGSNDSSADIMLIGGIADMPLRNKLGYSPFAPWEPMQQVDGTSLNDCIGNGSATYAPADDIYGNPRPMGRNTPDIGAVEANTQPVLDSTVYRLNTYSAKLPGAGYHNDLAEVVSGVAVKISRWVKWDTNYAGTKPQMVISNIPGADDITVTASGSADTWYELTTTFTPTASGAVLVKIKSNDASTNGNCWFADDSVTFP